MAPGIAACLAQAADSLDASSAMLQVQRQMLEAQGRRIATLEALVLNLCSALELDGGHRVDTHAVRMTIGPTMVPGDTEQMEHDPPPPDTREGRLTVRVPNLSMSDLVEGGVR